MRPRVASSIDRYFGEQRPMTTPTSSQSPSPLPPTILFVCIVAMIGLHFALPVARVVSSPWRALGAIPLAAGSALNIWSEGLFRKAATAVKPFDPSSALVETGPFQLSRNPMYLGMVLLLVGLAVCLGSLSPWGVVPVFCLFISRRFIAAEEQKLRATFGQEYERYASRVRRWL